MSVRKDIREFLEQRGGEFHAPDGNAGRLLSEELGHSYNNVSTTLYRMTKKGELVKEGTGRRAYAYRLANHHHSQIPHTSSIIGSVEAAVPSIAEAGHYDEIAAALLRRVVAVEEAHRQSSSSLQDVSKALSDAQSQLRASKRELSESRAYASSLEDERDQLIDEIRQKEAMLQALHNELEQKKRGKNRIRDLLDEQTVKELDKLMRERPTGKGD